MTDASNCTIRALTMHDMDTRGSVVVDQFNAHYQILDPHGTRATFASLSQSIRTPLNRHFVALTPADFICGIATYAVLRLARGLRASLEDVCVHPDYRGLGIGTKLTAAVIAAALADGMTSVSLVSPFNPDSVCNPISYRIYRRLGWEQAPGSQYLMRLQLANVDPGTLDLSEVEVK